MKRHYTNTLRAAAKRETRPPMLPPIVHEVLRTRNPQPIEPPPAPYEQRLATTSRKGTGSRAGDRGGGFGDGRGALAFAVGGHVVLGVGYPDVSRGR